MALSNKSSIAIALLTIAACAEAGGELRGGGVTETGEKATKPPAFAPDAAADDRPCGEGTKWSELYRDIFGPTGQGGSCVFTAACHGSPSGDGAGVGILCENEAGCRQSFIDEGLVSAANASNPDGAKLLDSILRYRKPNGTIPGFMPAEPIGYTFPPTCIERIKGWIARGIPAD